MDLTFKTLKPIWPMAQGMNMYIKRSVFEKFRGFDEEIPVGEDHEIVKRFTTKGAKFIYLKRPKVFTSVRRIKRVGHLKFATSMTLSFLFEHMVGYKKNPIGKIYQKWDNRK